MTIEKNIWADIQDGVTQGLAAAELVNDNKRAVNEVIDVVNPLVDQVDLMESNLNSLDSQVDSIQDTVDGLGTASTMTNASGGDTLGTASILNAATLQEALDGTAGVLPDAARVHAAFKQFGLGAPNALPNDADLNLIRTQGIYGVASNGVSNRPPGGLGSVIVVNYQTFDSVRCSQVYVDIFSRIHLRSNSGSNWTPWRELYHTGNIVGTVSQSGGVPTGAIIQRGSNANGEFVRFADGTQICTTIGDFTAAAVGTNLIIEKPHPAPFNTVSSVQYSAYSQIGFGPQSSVGAAYMNGVYTSATTTTVLYAACYTYREELYEPVRFYFTTMGRWY